MVRSSLQISAQFLFAFRLALATKMTSSPEKYQKARDFRKRGFSYTEIAKIVGVSRGTLSNWFGKQSFSKKVRVDNEVKARRDNVKRISLLNKARDKERAKQYISAKKTASTEFKHFKSSSLFLLSLGFYGAAGDIKHATQIRFPNQRATTHKIFRKFLVEFLGAEKSKIYYKAGVTILNDGLAKQKLITWLELVGKSVHKS
ncbi:MAG: hypothetical protein WD605_00880 [Candidatus Paceibacterota bacterium]